MPTPVSAAGIYHMPLADYIHDPCPQPSLNAGIAHVILTQSPRHAWEHHPRLNPKWQSEESSRADLGTVAHALLLEDDDSRLVIVEAEDWRTKAAKEARDQARASGKIPLLPKDAATVQAMKAAAIEAIYGSELCEAWMDAKAEQTLLWQEGGVWLRCRPDRLSTRYKINFSYKTASCAHPAMWGKSTLIRAGYDLQSMVEQRGIRALTGCECVTVFVVQEIESPYAVSFISLAPHFREVARERLELAIFQWEECQRTKQWPAYPSRIAYLDPPSWYGMDQLPEES